jgi:hypothetical protein
VQHADMQSVSPAAGESEAVLNGVPTRSFAGLSMLLWHSECASAGIIQTRVRTTKPTRCTGLRPIVVTIRCVELGHDAPCIGVAIVCE